MKSFTNRFGWLAVLAFVFMLLSGCVAPTGGYPNPMSFNISPSLSVNEQVYIRYSDRTPPSFSSVGPGTENLSLIPDANKTMVGFYVSDGNTSWVPKYNYGLLAPNSVSFSNLSETKPLEPASYAVMQGKPAINTEHKGFVNVTFAVYGSTGNLLETGRTEVFAHSNSDEMFFNTDPSDVNQSIPFGPGYTRIDTVTEGFSSYTEHGLVTFLIKSDTTDISSIPLQLFSGSNFIYDYASAQAVAADKDDLEIGYAPGNTANNVTNNLTLPTTGLSGTSITWTSSNPSVISTTGAVNRPSSSDANVTVTARVYKTGSFENKPFNLTVKQADSAPTGGGPSSSTPTTTIKIDGADVDTKVTRETSADGQSVTKVSVDADKLTNAFGQKDLITLGISNSDPIVKVDIPTKALLNIASSNPNAVAQIKVDGASYSLPVSVIKNLPKDATVTVTITKLSSKSNDDVKATAQKQGSTQLVTSAVDFTVTYGVQEVTDFKGEYVARTLSLTTSADFNKSTAVWVDENGKMHFIPSIFTTNGDSTEVTIHSPHNSVYTAIQSNKTFTDLQGHWAKADVELLANKLVVDGVTASTFAPDSQITRAEFSSLLVRALGLVEEKGTPSFTDVKATDWFANAVGTAQKAGFITGFEDGTFKPNANITREQMVVMIQRALKFVGKDAQANTNVLNKFNDQTTIAGWARDAAARALAANIIQGTSDTTFAAKENATRAQSASMLKRMMQYLQFIN
ncbi:S-layer homology domain-containing protein [Paenibacillus andongensis]|uniref:S-layer homology domain-containing protein n=1 Tax=Paenibacillus andongensis TaxID=2975482 RepID=UPI0021BAFD40|nr:S-layer homology domain-containing protein [Paenibacillus andongensis]